VCAVRDAKYRCSCLEVTYCSQKCQAQDWPRHKFVCSSVGGPPSQPTPLGSVRARSATSSSNDPMGGSVKLDHSTGSLARDKDKDNVSVSKLSLASSGSAPAAADPAGRSSFYIGAWAHWIRGAVMARAAHTALVAT